MRNSLFRFLKCWALVPAFVGRGRGMVESGRRPSFLGSTLPLASLLRRLPSETRCSFLFFFSFRGSLDHLRFWRLAVNGS